MSKEEILEGKLNEEELEEVAGGAHPDGVPRCQLMFVSLEDDDPNNCTAMQSRTINEPFFPNCAATVEDGSWCEDNDACYGNAVEYKGMEDCSKAWR